jgi:hypothetical protein
MREGFEVTNAVEAIRVYQYIGEVVWKELKEIGFPLMTMWITRSRTVDNEI